MRTVLLLKGLPACGKTTYAKTLMASDPNRWKRVNKDDLRAMLDDSVWHRDNERFVLALRDHVILEALKSGKDVIVDDTNLHPKHEANIRILVKGLARVEIYDSFEKDPNVCIDRDLKRSNSVGPKVIMGMYHQFMTTPVKTPKFNSNLGSCIICDIDGTLALFGDKNPYDRDFENDELNEPVARVIQQFAKDCQILFVSGRKERYRQQTEEWLQKNHLALASPYMRADDDNRKDSIVKREIYDKFIEGKYNVLFILDDRDQVVKLWRSLGLPCFQVAEGAF